MIRGYSGRDSEFFGSHLIGEPVNFSSGVAKDDGLGNIKSFVQVSQNIDFVVLSVGIDVELLDTLKGEFVSFHKNFDGVFHKFLCDFKGFRGHSSREKANLAGSGQVLEDIIDLVFESSRKHFIGFI